MQGNHSIIQLLVSINKKYNFLNQSIRKFKKMLPFLDHLCNWLRLCQKNFICNWQKKIIGVTNMLFIFNITIPILDFSLLLYLFSALPTFYISKSCCLNLFALFLYWFCSLIWFTWYCTHTELHPLSKNWICGCQGRDFILIIYTKGIK